jgi:hypothetical protein
MTERERFEKWLRDECFGTDNSTVRCADGLYYSTVSYPKRHCGAVRSQADVSLLWLAWRAAISGKGEV